MIPAELMNPAMLIGQGLPPTPSLTPEQKFSMAATEAEQKTDAGLARDILNATEQVRRKALLRELMWRWRDFPETDRPWKDNPDHVVWWEEFSP
jgi:hypothetical protein